MKGSTTVKIVDWNISYAGDINKKVDYIKTVATDDSIIMLQEVKPHAYGHIKETLEQNYHMIYSLDYRKPGKFDSDARKLGVLILVSKKYTIKSSGVVERSLFPDRTAYATVEIGDRTIKVLALHSLTGCAYYRAKSVQYESLTEFVDEYRPDIIGIDANEPQIDHYDINRMKFFDNGPGAERFFKEISCQGLNDAYVRFNGTDNFTEGTPLTKSHYIRRKGAVRYDFMFINANHVVQSCEYFYDDAIAAGSDHAIIICDASV